MAEGEHILYPCYFNGAYTRARGRKVPRDLAGKAPSLSEIERALRRLGIQHRAEDHHHPAHWARREGRLIVTWKGKKVQLIKKIAPLLSVRK
jgi:signal recognition particle subunit SRP19